MKKSKWDSDDAATSSDSESNDKAERKRRQKAAKKEAKRRKKEASSLASAEPQALISSNNAAAQQAEEGNREDTAVDLRQFTRGPFLIGCRHVDAYEKLNRIDEGTYGIVYRARDNLSGDVVALKRIKFNLEENGFPITALREISCLIDATHPNIVNVREVVVGDAVDRYLKMGCIPYLWNFNLYNCVFMVMDFCEHDLKGLMEHYMKQPFLQSEIKTIMLQVLSAVAYLHDRWIIHRDLKTSNLLMNNQGQIKVADFGLARQFAQPLPTMTPLVVTLWYRAPELLLGATEYSTEIDMWSVGCIFGELLRHEPMFPGQSEIDQVNKIFKFLGTPTAQQWPGFQDLPHVKTFRFASHPEGALKAAFMGKLTEQGMQLLKSMLAYDPQRRMTAAEALQHPYFEESPRPKHPSMFPTWPSKGEGERHRVNSPGAPEATHGGDASHSDLQLQQLYAQSSADHRGFQLRF